MLLFYLCLGCVFGGFVICLNCVFTWGFIWCFQVAYYVLNDLIVVGLFGMFGFYVTIS